MAHDGEATPLTPTTDKGRQATRPQRGKPHPKFDKEKGRGSGGRRNRNAEDAERGTVTSADGEVLEKALRYPKPQCALLMGFCGSGYSGMQIQPEPGPRTIERVLFNALVKIGAVSQDNADNPVKVQLARAARTDAGVHAAGNVVSLKMIVAIPGVKDLVATINEQLPPEIRVWGYGRTQNSFNARLVCDSRKYTYFFPSYLLIPPKPGSGIHRALMSHVERTPGAKPIPASDFWQTTDTSTEDDLQRKRSWRIGQEQLESLRKVVERFEGTHNFHNFTAGRDPKDRSCSRHMKKIEVADPVVYGETEWISVLFHGQSFMLHQASHNSASLLSGRRKMMTILVLSCRMGTPDSIIKELYGERAVLVPKMPALGLLLEEPLFHSYNQRVEAINEKFKPTDADYRPLIDFDIYRDQINAFKEVFIYKNMREVEDRDGLFDAWLRALDAYAGNDLLYLSPVGTIPDEAVITKGVRRDNPFREKRVFDATSFPDNGDIKKKLEETEDVDMEDDAPLDKRQLEETEG
ncbi:pseudouridine synthase [Crassisporium funariophilum]|nr:pseudouridine synthase [Crassisporium funariophilum]